MRCFIFPVVFLFVLKINAQTRNEERQVLQLVESFFHALETQDSAAFSDMFVKDGYLHAIWEREDSVRVRSQLPSAFRFRPGQVVKERMRSATTTVHIHRRIAVVWAPYDLWINEKFSHCGVDVFTLMNTPLGWKIASIAYTMEKEGCR